MFMKNGGILGFHCAYQYPYTSEGTYYYERYSRTLKGTDAVLFTLFRAFGLTVHIKPYDRCYYNATMQDRGLISTGGEPEVNQISKYGCGSYVGDEIFRSVAWFNKWVAREGGKEYHEVACPVTNWIGNETEIDWEYTFMALLIVVPTFSQRELED
jgi:hypothetical protein